MVGSDVIEKVRIEIAGDEWLKHSQLKQCIWA